MTRLLLTSLIIIALSCNKDDAPPAKYNPPPTVMDIQTSTEVINGKTYPKFSITLNVPDTAATEVFTLYYKSSTAPCTILKPKSATYTIIDTFNPYPLTGNKKEYNTFFVMEDNSTIISSTYTVN